LKNKFIQTVSFAREQLMMLYSMPRCVSCTGRVGLFSYLRYHLYNLVKICSKFTAISQKWLSFNQRALNHWLLSSRWSLWLHGSNARAVFMGYPVIMRSRPHTSASWSMQYYGPRRRIVCPNAK